jgi:hypothetical protein
MKSSAIIWSVTKTKLIKVRVPYTIHCDQKKTTAVEVKLQKRIDELLYIY